MLQQTDLMGMGDTIQFTTASVVYIFPTPCLYSLHTHTHTHLTYNHRKPLWIGWTGLWHSHPLLVRKPEAGPSDDRPTGPSL